MNAYAQLRAIQQAEVNAFPIKFAFSDEQVVEGMRELGLSPTDTDKIYAWREVNGFYRKSDASALHSMLERHARELSEAIAEDPTGAGFIHGMFAYELANHEYGYTGDLTDTLEALGFTLEEVNENSCLAHGLALAIAAQRASP